MTEGDKNILLPIGNKKQYFGIPLATPSEGDKVALIPIGNKKQYVAASIVTPSEGTPTVLISIGNRRQYVAVGIGVPPLPATGSIAWAPGIAYSWTTENASHPHLHIIDPDNIVRVNEDVSASGGSTFAIDKLGIWTARIYDGITLLDESQEMVEDAIIDPCFANEDADWEFTSTFPPWPAELSYEFLNEGAGEACGTCLHIYGTLKAGKNWLLQPLVGAHASSKGVKWNFNYKFGLNHCGYSDCSYQGNLMYLEPMNTNDPPAYWCGVDTAWLAAGTWYSYDSGGVVINFSGVNCMPWQGWCTDTTLDIYLTDVHFWVAYLI